MEALGSLLFRFLPPLALAVLLGGLAWRLSGLARRPQAAWPPLLPGPRSALGVRARLLGLGLGLGPLWHSSPGHWALAWLTHVCLFLVLAGHLGLFLAPAPAWWPWLATAARLAAQALPLLLLLGIMRRLALPVLRHFSRAEDYLAPGLLLALALSGLALRQPGGGPSPMLAAQARQLLELNPGAWPPLGWLWLHFALALALAFYLPWGKLAHGLLIWAAPAIAQADQAPARPAAWASPPPEPLETPSWGWSPRDYQAFLKDRWAGAGVHRVMGARERAHSLERELQGPGRGGWHGA